MEVVLSSEMSVLVRTTRRYVPVYGNIQNYRCENLRSVIEKYVLGKVHEERCTVFVVFGILLNDTVLTPEAVLNRKGLMSYSTLCLFKCQQEIIENKFP
jgi:hypothetical protein